VKSIPSSYLKIFALLLFVVALVFVFLGLDSEEWPTTIPFGDVGMILLAVSILVWILGLRRKARVLLLLISAAGFILPAFLNPPGLRLHVITSSIGRQMNAMRRIGLKLRQYDLDHPATETEDLKTKSIEDLVAMKVLTPADAHYLREHEVIFYGYDPDHLGADVPLFETVYVHANTRKRMICFADLHVVTSPVESKK
jgi:hypothetical protein